MAKNYPTYQEHLEAFSVNPGHAGWTGIPCRLIPKSGTGQVWQCWRADIRKHRPFVPVFGIETDLVCTVDIRKYNIWTP